MSHWNYRVVDMTGTPEAMGEIMYGIVEAYYGEDGLLQGYTDPVILGESLENLSDILGWMSLALTKPTIPYTVDEHEDVANAR